MVKFYAFLLALLLATSSALAFPLPKGQKRSILHQRDLDQEVSETRRELLSDRDTYHDDGLELELEPRASTSRWDKVRQTFGPKGSPPNQVNPASNGSGRNFLSNLKKVFTRSRNNNNAPVLPVPSSPHTNSHPSPHSLSRDVPSSHHGSANNNAPVSPVPSSPHTNPHSKTGYPASALPGSSHPSLRLSHDFVSSHQSESQHSQHHLTDSESEYHTAATHLSTTSSVSVPGSPYRKNQRKLSDDSVSVPSKYEHSIDLETGYDASKSSESLGSLSHGTGTYGKGPAVSHMERPRMAQERFDIDQPARRYYRHGGGDDGSQSSGFQWEAESPGGSQNHGGSQS